MTSSSTILLSATTLLAALAAGCEPKVVVGEWTCPSPDAGTDYGEIKKNVGEPVKLGWSTSFERDFCDYARVHSYCYADPGASFSIVSTQAHSGKYSAAFTVNADTTSARQARCVRQGDFPESAYYSAWYFIPVAATNTGNWNLFHFQGGDQDHLDGLFDVSLHSADGELSAYFYDTVADPAVFRGLGETPSIPIGTWFELGVYWRRAADESGELSLYQNGERILHYTGLVTDKTSWGQWYVGNLANALAPPDSTLYVDDVAIREAP